MKKINLKLTLVTFILVAINKLNAQDVQYPDGASDPCVPNASSWVLGGNNVLVSTCSHCPPPFSDAGTCNNVPFILKANNLQSVFILPNTNVGIGLNNSNPTAALDIQNNIGGSHFKIYGDAAGNAESTTDINMYCAAGKEFRINEGTVSNNTNNIIIKGGRTGIGTWGMADAKLEVQQNDMLTSNTGNNSLLITRFAGNCNGYNTMKQSNWLYRNGTQTNWESASLHDGISVDVSYLTPHVDTKTWWERNPHFDVQSWGNDANTYMKLEQGKLHIGTKTQNANVTHAGALLTVYGKIVGTEVVVTQLNWSDFVFDKNYKLLPLNEVENFYLENHHLPSVPSAKEIVEKGNDLGNTDALLLQKIEELTLYMVDQNKLMQEQKKQISDLQKQVEDLKANK